MSAMTSQSLAEQADTLLDLWHSLALQHVALGGACGCGVGGVSLRLEDFEQDIVGYLEDTGLRSDEAGIAAFFQHRDSAAPQALRGLLEDARAARLPPEVSAWLLPRVERTLRSFAALHAPARGDTSP